MFNNQWRERALAAEAMVKTLTEALTTADERLQGIDLLLADRATLVSLKREGRFTVFVFVRNGEMYEIKTYTTMDDDPNIWRRQLLERKTDGKEG